MENLTRQENMTKALATMQFYPLEIEETQIQEYTKLPLSKIATMGTAFEPLKTMVSTASSSGGSGLYQVTVPAGTHLAELKNGAGNIGTALGTNNQISGQAVLNPVALDPTMLFMAAALANIDKKLDAIQEVQLEILGFLQKNKRAELHGNLKFIEDTMKNYKYNWNNSLFKSSNYIKAMDVRQNAEKNIHLSRSLIKEKLEKHSFIEIDQETQKQVEHVKAELKDYQLSLYVFSFASMLEVMLLENYDKDFLSSIAQKIRDYALSYREMYTDCYNKLEEKKSKTIQANLIKGIAKVSRLAGETIEKVPVISKSMLDENLIEAGEKLSFFNDKRIKSTMDLLTDKQVGLVSPFADGIEMIGKFYSQDFILGFDAENIYIENLV